MIEKISQLALLSFCLAPVGALADIPKFISTKCYHLSKNIDTAHLGFAQVCFFEGIAAVIQPVSRAANTRRPVDLEAIYCGAIRAYDQVIKPPVGPNQWRSVEFDTAAGRAKLTFNGLPPVKNGRQPDSAESGNLTIAGRGALAMKPFNLASIYYEVIPGKIGLEAVSLAAKLCRKTNR